MPAHVQGRQAHLLPAHKWDIYYEDSYMSHMWPHACYEDTYGTSIMRPHIRHILLEICYEDTYGTYIVRPHMGHALSGHISKPSTLHPTPYTPNPIP